MQRKIVVSLKHNKQWQYINNLDHNQPINYIIES